MACQGSRGAGAGSDLILNVSLRDLRDLCVFVVNNGFNTFTAELPCSSSAGR